MEAQSLLPCSQQPATSPNPQTDQSSPSPPILILILIYLLTASGLPPSGCCTIHIYTQTIHRTTQNKQYIEQHKILAQHKIWEQYKKRLRTIKKIVNIHFNVIPLSMPVPSKWSLPITFPYQSPACTSPLLNMQKVWLHFQYNVLFVWQYPAQCQFCCLWYPQQ
jgi:hypothetical protein